jgi:hypothetical protein
MVEKEPVFTITRCRGSAVTHFAKAKMILPARSRHSSQLESKPRRDWEEGRKRFCGYRMCGDFVQKMMATRSAGHLGSGKSKSLRKTW